MSSNFSSFSKHNDPYQEVPETIPFVEEPLLFEDGTEQVNSVNSPFVILQYPGEIRFRHVGR